MSAMVFTDPASQCLAFRLKRASRGITRLYDEALAPCGLKITQFTLLTALVQSGGLPIGRLASMLGLDRTTLSRNIKPLERRGLITVSAGPGRRRCLQATEAGRDLALLAQQPWADAQRRAYELCGPALWQRLHQDLAALTAHTRAQKG